MPADAPSLDLLRAEIDGIDAAIHDLIMRRAAIVEQVGAAKAGEGGPAFRPHREAAILRRLLERHKGAFPRAALVQIWRELIGASVAMQSPLSIAMDEGDAWARQRSRDYFGAAAGAALVSSAEAAIDALSRRGATLAVATVEDGAQDPWWRALAVAIPTIQVIMRLPLVIGAREKGEPEALVLARATETEDGATEGTVLIVETSAEIEPDDWRAALEAAGHPVAVVARGGAPRGGAPRGGAPRGQLTLLLFDALVPAAGELAAALRDGGGLPIKEAFIAGGYPHQINR